jgi:putative membrane protein
MRTQVKAFNPQTFLEFLCYGLFGGLLFHLVRSGKYLSYVTPRMKPYLYFTAIVMLIWAFAVLGRLFRPQHRIRAAHSFAPSGSDTNAAAATQPDTNVSAPADSAPPDAQADAATGDHTAALSGLDAENKRITVENDEFYPWLLELYNHLDQYEGYTIAVTGFVFKDPEYFAENEFVPARLAMVCCAADLAPIGLLCKYDPASQLDADSWVTVEGVIYKGQYEGQDEPEVTVSKVTPAEEVEGYIYPY